MNICHQQSGHYVRCMLVLQMIYVEADEHKHKIIKGFTQRYNVYWNRSGLLFNHFVLTVIPIHIFSNQLLIGIPFVNPLPCLFLTIV